jgi:hypothetical protein
MESIAIYYVFPLGVPSSPRGIYIINQGTVEPKTVRWRLSNPMQTIVYTMMTRSSLSISYGAL